MFALQTAEQTGPNGLPRGHILTVAPDGSGLRDITPDFDYATMPAVSPDGRTVVFAGVEDVLGSEEDDLDLFIVDLAGGTPQELDIDGEVPEHDSWPTWAPDGRTVVFASRSTSVPGPTDPVPTSRIRSFDTSTEEVQELSDLGYEAVDDWHPSVSPATATPTVAFVRQPDGEGEDPELVSVSFDPDAGALGPVTPITANDVEDYGVDWSPDGTRVAYTSGTTTIVNDGTEVEPAWSAVFDFDIHTVGAAGGDSTAVTEIDGFVGEPAWSPDGSWIVFQTGGTDLAIVPADGSSPAVPLNLEVEGGVDFPDWAPVPEPRTACPVGANRYVGRDVDDEYDWFRSANWSAGHVPQPDENVCITSDHFVDIGTRSCGRPGSTSGSVPTRPSGSTRAPRASRWQRAAASPPVIYNNGTIFLDVGTVATIATPLRAVRRGRGAARSRARRVTPG